MANEAICSLEMRKVGSSDSVYRAKKHKAATISMGPVLCVFLKLMSCLDDLTILVYLGDDMQSAAQRSRVEGGVGWIRWISSGPACWPASAFFGLSLFWKQLVWSTSSEDIKNK